MNKLKKIGLTALAASLVSTSVFAGTYDVSGSAVLYFNGSEKATTGNGWSMNDSISFSGGGEMDNGWNVTAAMKLDNSDGTSGAVIDNRSIAIDMNDMGTLTFYGAAGDSVISATDDKLPNMYEESFHGAGTPGKGATTGNMFYYSNSTIVDGVAFDMSYTPSGTAEVSISTEFGVTYSGVDGLVIGYATGTDNGAGATAEVDNKNMWATYAYDSVTVGYQANSSDSMVAAADEDYTAMVITYTISDELAVSYGTSEISYENNGFEQESSSIGASYTMGSMSIAGVHNTHDNVSGGSTATDDKAIYEIALTFAF